MAYIDAVVCVYACHTRDVCLLTVYCVVNLSQSTRAYGRSHIFLRWGSHSFIHSFIFTWSHRKRMTESDSLGEEPHKLFNLLHANYESDHDVAQFTVFFMDWSSVILVALFYCQMSNIHCRNSSSQNQH